MGSYLDAFAIGILILLLVLITWIAYKNVASRTDNILLCIATDEEKWALIKTVRSIEQQVARQGGRVDILITGVGVMRSTVGLLDHLSAAPKNYYSRILNIGFVGGFNQPAGKPNLSGPTRSEKWIPIGTIYDMTLPADSRSPPIVLDPSKAGLDPSKVGLETHTEFVETPNELKNRNNLADMEGYALATIAKAFGIKFDCYKLISDSGNLGDYTSSVRTTDHPILDLSVSN